MRTNEFIMNLNTEKIHIITPKFTIRIKIKIRYKRMAANLDYVTIASTLSFRKTIFQVYKGVQRNCKG
jgi:hypothetical protein